MSMLGSRVLRTEDPRLLTDGGTYVDDLREPALEGALFATFVRSGVAHGRITVDVEEARQAPGVVAVLTAADVDVPPMLPNPPLLDQAMPRPVLASDEVRFVGEPIALVLTEERYQGPDAAELVVVDVEPLPAVIGVESAVADGAPLVHEAAGRNVCFEFGAPADDAAFAGCDVVVERRIVNQRVAACPLEVRSSAAAFGAEGRVTLWISNQAPHGVKAEVAARLALDPAQVRVVAPDVGGGFGAKIACYAEDVVVAWAARHLGRPVRWTETRGENMLAMGHGRGQVQTVKIGGTRDGKVLAYHLDVLQDAGAYPTMGGILPFLTQMMVPGTYDIPAIGYRARSLATTTTPTVAYRGAGRPEATAAVERAIDLFAAELGLDAVEVRRRNLIAKDAFPFTTPVGTTYDCGDYAQALDHALAAAGYDELRAEQRRRREAGDPKLLGIGVSTYVEVTAGPYAGSEHGSVEVREDGHVVVRTGSSSHGQGHETAFAMLAADRLGVPLEQITVLHGDTDEVPKGEGTMGSRSLQLGGSAVASASEAVLDKAKRLAADLLEANADDIVLDAGRGAFHVAGTPAIAKTWAELAASPGADLRAETDFQAASPTFPYGAHVAVVEVDSETGKVVLTRMVTCDDAGTILNPLLAEGQRHGGIAQGVAQALLEEFRYDADGNPQTANLADYTAISACELPTFELATTENPTPVNPLGAKGIGESGTIGSTPAVQSAVCDALAHLGVRHVDMPCTPERVWQAIQAGVSNS